MFSDHEKFLKYLEALCAKLPPNSCIIMDNASYHCKLVSLHFPLFCSFPCSVLKFSIFQCDDVPKSDWKKDQLKKWLEEKGATFEENKKYLKKDYWDMVKPIVDAMGPKYNAEDIMNKYGVKCLRLPP